MDLNESFQESYEVGWKLICPRTHGLKGDTKTRTEAVKAKGATLPSLFNLAYISENLTEK